MTHAAQAATEPLAESPTAAGAAAAFVQSALADARRRCAASSILAVSVPAPRVPIEQALDALPPADRVLWDPPSGLKLATAGCAAVASASGDSRFSGLKRAAAAIYNDLVWTKSPQADAPPPRMVGGVAFAPGQAAAPPWTDFGDGGFSLPIWTYGLSRESAFVTFCSRASACDPQRAAESTLRLLVALAKGEARRKLSAAAVTAVRKVARAAWNAQVGAALEAIARGEAQKLVTARATEVHAAAAIDPRVVLDALAQHRGCFRFAICRGAATFIGATPETLIEKRQSAVTTEALAGSIAAGADPQVLLRSEKDRREHGFVVDAITRKLAPFCRDLDWPRAPTPRALRHVVHLRTPIAGQLARPTHILDLCQALHPTPAVGGIPGDGALAWIARTEREPRGWYAAPVGWFDAEGDGELVVAIRSAILAGARALLYAGAGIVAGSDPDAEYDETAIKERAMLDALIAP